MKTFAPLYYKDFKCIADKCRHSCCVGWEIDIDSITEEKYSRLSDGYGKKLSESIDYDDTPHFRLEENERCPHLDTNGLCRIICEYGEEYLCDICREHPRFYNRVPNGLEVGLGMACEEACRIILKSDSYREMIDIESGERVEFYGYRQKIYSILSNRTIPYHKRLEEIYRVFGVSPTVVSDSGWREYINSLEYINDSHKELFLNCSSDITTDKRFEENLERALAYFVYRHCTEVENEEDFIASLGFCLFCERLISSVTVDDVFETARSISEEIEYSEDNTEIIKNIFLVLC